MSLYEGDIEALHNKTLYETGFWGKAGAGCIFIAKDTGKILLNHRSMNVEEPDTWGVWGGAIDHNETPLMAVKREAFEEAGFYPSNDSILPIYRFEDKETGFVYHNFIVVVDSEFDPIPHEDSLWETQGYGWFEFGKWPSPLHFGVEGILSDTESVNTILKIINT